MASTLEERLGRSGVQIRCGDCGQASRWQRELRLAPRWSLTWVVIDGRSWPKYLCPDCKGTGVEKAPARGSLEDWRAKLEAKKKTKKRRGK